MRMTAGDTHERLDLLKPWHAKLFGGVRTKHDFAMFERSTNENHFFLRDSRSSRRTTVSVCGITKTDCARSSINGPMRREP